MARRRPGRRRRSRRAGLPPSGPAPKRPARSPAGARKAVPAPERQDPLLGRTIGRCRIEERIGQGRTSIVYRAQHEALGATVAIKILLPSAAANPQLVAKLETEARAVAQIDNENVLKIYDVGAEGKLHYIVMELLEGEEILDTVAREGRMDIMDALRIVRQTANGLAAAHARDIVHRDVKPQNLFLLEDGTVKVVDFGLATAGEGQSGRVGTPHFMAPETCESGESTIQSDIYSLGITLYYLLIGEPPYAGQDVRSILRSHAEGEPIQPERRRPGLPGEVVELIGQLTAKAPGARPSAREVIARLDQFGGEALQEKTTLRRRRSRMRAHIASRRQSASGPLLVAIILVGGAILAFVALRSRQGDGESTPPRRSPTRPPISRVPSTPTVPRPQSPAAVPTPARPPTAGEIAAQKDRERQEKAAEAFAAAEDWARLHWREPSHTEGVIERYEEIKEQHKGTRAADDATLRIVRIRKKDVHPHPDRSWSTQERVAEVRKVWAATRPQVEELIDQYKYYQARLLVPEPVHDDDGRLGGELAFWRTLLDELSQFKVAMGKEVVKVPEESRLLKTPHGQGTVIKVTSTEFTLEADAGVIRVPWTEVEPVEVARLARHALPMEVPRYALRVMAFAFAHRLWNAFWDADLDLPADLDADQRERVRGYKARLEERKAR